MDSVNGVTSRQHYMLAIIALQNEHEKIIQLESQIYADHLKNCQSRITETDKKIFEMLKNRSQEIRSEKIWETIGSGMQVLLSTFSIVAGIHMIPIQPVTGSLLAISGSLGLANFFMKETNGYEWIAQYLTQSSERQRLIADTMNGSAAMISAFVSIASSLRAYEQGNLLNGNPLFRMIQLTTTVGQKAIQFQIAMIQNRIIQVNATIRDENVNRKCDQLSMESTCGHFQSILHQSKIINDCVRKLI